MVRQRWAVGYTLLSWVRLSVYFFPPLGSQSKRTTLSAVEYVARQKQNVIFLCKIAKKWEAEVAHGARQDKCNWDNQKRLTTEQTFSIETKHKGNKELKSWIFFQGKG